MRNFNSGNFVKSTKPDGIVGIAESILDAVPDLELAAAIRAAFAAEISSIDVVERTFLQLTERQWNTAVLMKFFHAWKDTHLSSSSVSALVCRLLDEWHRTKKIEFIFAANALAQVVHEDLGLCGETHARLYERMATSCCGNDQWKLQKNSLVGTADFGAWVHKQRVSSSIEEAIVTTIISEIYNHGEYTFVAPLFRRWFAESHDFDVSSVQSVLAYVVVHTGATESDHFLSGVEALANYLQGASKPFDYINVTYICRNYLRKLAVAFADIEATLSASPIDFAPSSRMTVPVH